jgi:Tfp pilus assembly protein PilN
MLKINLLPKTFGQRKRVRNIALLMGVVLLFIVGGFFGWYNSVNGQIEDVTQEIKDLDPVCAQVDQAEQAKVTTDGQNAALKAKVDYIDAVLAYNNEYPALLELVDNWVYAKVQVTAIGLGGAGGGSYDQVSLQCYTDSLDSFARQYNFILDSGQYFVAPTISDPTPGIGWPTAGGATISSETLGGPQGLFRSDTGYAFSIAFGVKEQYAIRAPTYTPAGGGAGAAPGAGGQGAGAGPGGGTPPPPAPPGGGAPLGGAAGGMAPGGGRPGAPGAIGD